MTGMTEDERLINQLLSESEEDEQSLPQLPPLPGDMGILSDPDRPMVADHTDEIRHHIHRAALLMDVDGLGYDDRAYWLVSFLEEMFDVGDPQDRALAVAMAEALPDAIN